MFYLLFNHKPYFFSGFQFLKNSFPLLPSSSFLGQLIVCYGADLSWAASFCLMIQSINCFDNKKMIRLHLCSVLGAAYEFLQLAGIVSGTFDIFDLAAYAAGTICAILIIKMIWRKKDEK